MLNNKGLADFPNSFSPNIFWKKKKKIIIVEYFQLILQCIKIYDSYKLDNLHQKINKIQNSSEINSLK